MWNEVDHPLSTRTDYLISESSLFKDYLLGVLKVLRGFIFTLMLFINTFYGVVRDSSNFYNLFSLIEGTVSE